MTEKTRDKPIAGAGFFIAILFFGAIWAWENLILGGRPPDAADNLYIGIFRYVAWISLLIGVGDIIRRYIVERRRAKAMETSDAFGSARFATARECWDEGLMDANGLYLGLVESRPLFYDGKAHLLTVAPARQGKGISVVIPNLLHFQGSVFVTDPKGELAGVTAKHRGAADKFAQDVFILNPWGLHGLPQHCYNPLDPLMQMANETPAQRGIVDEARAIAQQLVPEPPDAQNRYFREGSRQILRAVMLHFATREQPEECTLPKIWSAISSRRRLETLIVEMTDSPALGGLVSDLAQDLHDQMYDNAEQFHDFRQGAVQALEIFDPHSWLAKAVSRSDVDFRALKDRRVSVYLVIPQDRITTHGAWLGLLTRQAISAVTRSQGRTPVLFMLDEFANMGKLEGLAESLTGLPGLGVRVWAIVQEMAELERIYGRETAQTIESQAEVKQYFSVQNSELAKRLSDMLGEQTIKTGGMNFSTDPSADPTISITEVGRKLMTPDQIRQLPSDKQILLIKNMLPILADRVPFWRISPWATWANANPVEGSFPSERPVLKLQYSKK